MRWSRNTMAVHGEISYAVHAIHVHGMSFGKQVVLLVALFPLVNGEGCYCRSTSPGTGCAENNGCQCYPGGRCQYTGGVQRNQWRLAIWLLLASVAARATAWHG